jgi:8-oxo-dGTP pyrophosphatase MutT (NUDIX family)
VTVPVMSPTSRWDPESLRERLRDAAAEPQPWHLPGDNAQPLDASAQPTAASVLIALLDRPRGPTIVLTTRAAHLNAHAGQISLPGGRMEVEDISAVAAALRESDEEIGLAAERVDVLGSLRAYDTITGFRVHPVVGWVAEPPPAWRRDPAEVADVFEVPLDFVLEPANHRRDSYLRNGEVRHFFVLPFENRYIWGATAGILVNFARTLGG